MKEQQYQKHQVFASSVERAALRQAVPGSSFPAYSAKAEQAAPVESVSSTKSSYNITHSKVSSEDRDRFNRRHT